MNKNKSLIKKNEKETKYWDFSPVKTDGSLTKNI